MNTEKLFYVLNKIAPLSECLKARIVTLLKEEHYNKGTLLLREGQIAKRIYFIQKGFCRAYHLEDGKEYTTWFMGETDIMISVYSFFTQKTSFEYIEAVEETTLLSLSWEQLQSLYREFPEFNLFGRIITELYYIKSEERAISLRNLPASERYLMLVKTYPAIIQKAPLGQIASHLGISQETLSRIRAKK